MVPLIAYFSYSSAGYTRRVAETIHVLTNGDLFDISPQTPYPADRTACENLVRQQLETDFLPALSRRLQAERFAAYRTVYLGYPSWCGTLPPPVRSFLSAYDFAGKHIVPFSTYETSGLGDGVEQILRRANSLGTLEALAFHLEEIGTRKWERAMVKWVARTNREWRLVRP